MSVSGLALILRRPKAISKDEGVLADLGRCTSGFRPAHFKLVECVDVGAR